MAIPPEFLEELKARLPATDVVGRRVKLIRSGRDTKGCCPFHKEKTPSFHVYDDHYHCFGCGAHGSVIDFVMESEGLEFREAVQRLAGEAGLPMPEETPEDRERRARN
ncbi:MAG: CHC2 zinc finger domain-containing protein, partial [Alphaproteobacteria bacterium]